MKANGGKPGGFGGKSSINHDYFRQFKDANIQGSKEIKSKILKELKKRRDKN